MTTSERDMRIAAEIATAREEYAEEEAEAADFEVAERNAALTIPLNLRIDATLDAELKRRSAAAQIPTSALVRRLLRNALAGDNVTLMTEAEVEAIARRVLAEAK